MPGERAQERIRGRRKALADGTRRALTFGGLSGLCLVALLVYRPWEPQPFDVLDFSEFLLVLQRLDGPWEQWAGLAAYYASQGRVNEVGYAVITANYQLFGLESMGWRIVGALQLLALPWAVFAVLRRFGAGTLAAVIGASLFAVGSIPTSAWLRQTGEPVGTMFMLAAAAMARGWTERRADIRRTAVLTACLIGMVLSKETLVACLPFLLGVATCWSTANEVCRPRFVRSAAYFTVACLIACATLAAALLWAASQWRVAPYTALYGTTALTGGVLATRAAQMTLPVFAYGELWKVVVFPPNLVFVSGIALGIAHLTTVRSAVAWKVGLALWLPVAGALIYLPWPKFELFYALPFLFGIALAIALMIDASSLGSRSRSILIACWLFVLTGSALSAIGPAQFTRAHRHLNDAVAQWIASYGPADTVHVLSAGITSQAWQNPAATLGRYARAVGFTERPPLLVDVDCRDIDRGKLPTTSARTPLIVFEATCGVVQGSSGLLEYPYVVFNWSLPGFERRVDRAAMIEQDGSGTGDVGPRVRKSVAPPEPTH